MKKDRFILLVCLPVCMKLFSIVSGHFQNSFQNVYDFHNFQRSVKISYKKVCAIIRKNPFILELRAVFLKMVKNSSPVFYCMKVKGKVLIKLILGSEVSSS